jgi:hypothetical protein
VHAATEIAQRREMLADETSFSLSLCCRNRGRNRFDAAPRNLKACWFSIDHDNDNDNDSDPCSLFDADNRASSI